MATLKRPWLAAIAAAGALLTVPLIGFPGGSQIVTLAVTAQISPSGSFKVQANTPDVVVSADEPSQGYVDISSSLIMNVGKLRPDLVVEFSPDTTGFASLLVRADARQSRRDSMLKPPSENPAGFDTRALVEQATAAVLSYRASVGEAAKLGQYGEPVVIAINL